MQIPKNPQKCYNLLMLITKLHTKDYTEFNDSYQLVRPLNLEDLKQFSLYCQLTATTRDFKKFPYQNKLYPILLYELQLNWFSCIIFDRWSKHSKEYLK